MQNKFKFLFVFLLVFSFVCLPALAKEEGDKKDDGKEDGIDWENWENPFSETDYYQKAFKELEDIQKNGDCWKNFGKRTEIFRQEVRFWRYQSDQKGKAWHSLTKVASELQSMGIKMAKNRTALENKNKGCLDGFEGINDAYEEAKGEMRKAAYYLSEEGGGMAKTEYTKAEVTSFQAKSLNMNNTLKDKIINFDEELQQQVADGEIEEVSYSKEIINLAKEYYNAAVDYYNAAALEETYENQAKNYVAAIAEGNLGYELFKKAKKFKDGIKEDDAGDFEQVKAKIKVLLEIVADKQVVALQIKDAGEVIEKLNLVKAQLIEVEKELIAYVNDDQVDEETINNLNNTLTSIQENLAEIDVLLEAAEEDPLTQAEKKKKAKQLIKQARQHIKELNQTAAKKDKKADTQEEEDFVQFAEKTNLTDAQSLRNIANTYKKEKEYEAALESAYAAIQTAKIGKELLKEVK